MLVFEDGEQLGTIGGGSMEARVLAAAADALRTGTPRLLNYELVDPGRGDPGVCGGEVQIYLESYMPPHTIYVVGCGHVGKAVIDLAHWLGYRTVAVDDREEQVTKSALPNSDERVAGSLTEALQRHPPTEDASIVLVTRAVDIDLEAIPAAVSSPVRYIGVMGSKKRWVTTRRRLREAGHGEDLVERIHAPVGMELYAETLEEIAVSILAEVIAVNRGAAVAGTKDA